MRVQRLAVSKINPAPYNPRLDLKPGDPEYEKLRRSIDTFGLVEPLVWNKRTGHLVGGHQRFKVLLARGDKSVDVSVVDLPPEQEKALNIALNKIGGDWDPRKLAELLDELVQMPDFDVSLTGFDPMETDALFAEVLGRGAGSGGETETFDVEAAMAAADAAKGPTITRPGETLRLGNHLLLCGDCTDPVAVRALVKAGGGKAVLFATDPPYLVNYDGTNHFSSNKPSNGRQSPRRGVSRSPAKGGSAGAKNWSGSYGITWDDADANSDLYEKFIRVAVDEAIHPTAPWYCWHASRRQMMLEQEWIKAGAFVHQQIIWAKHRPILTRSFYTWAHEPCLMGWIRGNQPKRMKGEPMLPSVWTIPSAASANMTDGSAAGPAPYEATAAGRPDHPTPKPLELFEIPIRQHTRAGDRVYEPFCGSGTQLIAAERLGRRCLAVEISPRYCDVIARRWLSLVTANGRPMDKDTLKLAERYGVTPAGAAALVEAKPRAASSRKGAAA